MLASYFPVLVFIVAGFCLGLALIVVGNIINRHQPDPEKCSPYECGFEPFEDSRLPFDIRFYLVAILFIIFDLETAFLFPILIDSIVITKNSNNHTHHSTYLYNHYNIYYN